MVDHIVSGPTSQKMKLVMNKDFDSMFLKCDCSSHTLEIERFNYGKHDRGFNISSWILQRNSTKLPWRQRFRWIIQILTTGELWSDNIVLSDKNAIKLSDYIKNSLDKRL